MRTNIDIDDELLAKAQAATGATTKKETVRLGLELLVRLDQQKALRSLRGALDWDDDLERMRTS
ncbi:VapB protein of antitoxin of type II toxin-antitoxin system [Branchiibius hedensis]|uniref:Antitoxin of type II TA system, VapB n=1 Tax=Branchiibius hedensis TaxID=672460 RepID=A0A2Y9BUU2_9MICO|nr:type II toxin-antitoxin system VapB family antitoxin [Branchiibius hedensis]PWJ27472.1 VapB protein of antitoxin of type II toxin-antitoxin system [Branchiibius hedensis]SSA36282.1 antitoxin of type II TA system, VapB [Branchiibius hedensis]